MCDFSVKKAEFFLPDMNLNMSLLHFLPGSFFFIFLLKYFQKKYIIITI